MACAATLKRTMDFDPLMMSPISSKRRRKDAQPPSSQYKRRRCEVSPSSPSSPSSSAPRKYLRMEPSPFGRSPSAASGLDAEQLLNNIQQECRRFQRVKHPDCCSPPESPTRSSAAASAFSLAPGSPCGGAVSPTKREQPLFTLRQVGMICERLLKEREEKVREEYDETLSAKLAEQYDTFVKFTHDQWMRQFGERHDLILLLTVQRLPPTAWCCPATPPTNTDVDVLLQGPVQPQQGSLDSCKNASWELAALMAAKDLY